MATLPQSGALMTLSEAREVLVHRTLCPEEDRWAAVLVDNHQAQVLLRALWYMRYRQHQKVEPLKI